jgi:hypothetical protein
MINDCGDVDVKRLTGEVEVLLRTPTPVSFCPPQLPYELNWNKTWAEAMEACDCPPELW